MSNPYITLLVGSLNSSTIPSLCLVHQLNFLRSVNIWQVIEGYSLILHPCFWISTIQISQSFLLHFLRLLRFGFFLLNTSMWTANFIFSCTTEWLQKHASSGLGCAHSILCVFFLHQPDFRLKGRLNSSSCPLDCTASGISSNEIASHFTSFSPNLRDITVLSGPVCTNACRESG
jgi:hypothetical protein